MTRYAILILLIITRLCAEARGNVTGDRSCMECCIPPVALRSNLLSDAALIPNVGVTVPIAGRWAADLSWSYAWWSNDSRHRYWRTYGGNAEIRLYLGNREHKNRLEGHHLGIYGQMFTYDFELGGKGRMAPKWSAGGGIAYGYTLAITGRLSLDFTIGIAYITGKEYRYQPISDRYVWQSTRDINYMGPTRCEVSLVWLIGKGNVNPSKIRQR